MAANASHLQTEATAAARAARLLTRCDVLAPHSEESGRITRPYGTQSLLSARDDLAAWMTAACMAVRTDAIGTLRGRYGGSTENAPAFLIGSHFDSVRDAGRYDGVLGILVGIALVERLSAAQRRLPFPIEVVAFPDEEGLRFQTTYLGSSVLAGTFEPELLAWQDADGVSLREAVTAIGGNPDILAACALAPDEAFAYLEVHIEQGPYLESVSAPLGVVTAISGQTRALATLTGEAGHAGTVAMPLRHDPLPAAAELILAAERMARETPGLLATVGKIEALPGASNVIPGRVEFSLDVRHPEDAKRLSAVSALETRGHDIANERGLRFEWRDARNHAAVACNAELSVRLETAIADAGIPPIRLPSGAGHDAAVMATRLPVAMLFVRCAGGISHHPAESVLVEDVAYAIDVVDRLVDALAARTP